MFIINTFDMQNREEVSHLAHNQENGGSNPSSATNYKS